MRVSFPGSGQEMTESVPVWRGICSFGRSSRDSLRRLSPPERGLLGKWKRPGKGGNLIGEIVFWQTHDINPYRCDGTRGGN